MTDSLGSPMILTNGKPEHGDLGFDDNGDEVYAMLTWEVISYFRLRDGAHFNLTISDDNNPIGYGHLSCRNSNRPGWCYFSSYEKARIGAARISATASMVEHWGFHRSSADNYGSQPKGTSSRSGSSFLYTSDWYSRGEANDYMTTCEK